MKLQAVTVSVNYPDFLDHIAPNKRHFDRWLIVTDESDRETIRVCEKHGLESLYSKRLYEKGAAFDKAKALNEGLYHLDNDGWVVVLDSDIYLPARFRERLEAQDLDPQTLYGLAARRVCLHHDEFRVLAQREPWRHAWRARFVIGYFHLFHFSQEHNRYPEEISDDASAYDMVFSDLFPENRKRKLPMSCLHLGPVRENWRGRKAKLFTQRKSPIADSGFPDLLSAIAPRDRDGTVIAQVGYLSATTNRAFARAFGRVLLFDQWRIDTPHHDPVVEADRAVLRGRFWNGVDDIGNLERRGGHSSEGISQVEDGCLDAIYFDGEIDYDFLLAALPEWLPKLKPGAFVAGAHFGHPHWPTSTYAISLLLGTPNFVFGDSSWAIGIPESIIRAGADRLDYPLAPPIVSGARLSDGLTDRGVILVSNSRADVEGVIVRLHALRKHWKGPVCVVETREETPSLRIACARYGALYRNSFDVVEVATATERLPDPKPPPEELDPAAGSFVRALQSSPFQRTVFLSPSILAVGPVDECFDLLEDYGAAFGPGQGGKHGEIASAIGGWRRAGLLPENFASGGDLASWISLDMIAFRNDEAFLERWADLAAVAGGRNLPMPDEIAALAAVSQAGTESTVAPAEWFHSRRHPCLKARFVQVTEDDLASDDRACDAWGECEEEVIRSMASEIRVPDSITIATFVHPDNLDLFYRNWHAWRFPAGVVVKVIASGLEKGDLFFVRPEEAEIHCLAPCTGTPGNDRPAALVRDIPPLIESGHWIYLDPPWYPLPGAELFMHEDWLNFDLVAPAQLDSTDTSPGDFVAELEPDFALIRTEFSCAAKSASLSSLASAARGLKRRVAACEPQLMGWRRVGPLHDTESAE